ncbi:unnamed protein product [Orchesella dallaii]|uniref:Gustatory receptor n=1 Tax=Orchesella dallaii TaxID=48710 RepID=A0ABP1S5D2_9HEXA
MFKSFQRWFGNRKPHRVQPSNEQSCMELGGQPVSETPVSQAPQEISITVSTAESSSGEASIDDTDTGHGEQAEELRSIEINSNDVGSKKPSSAGLEMLLNVDYYLGLSPFRLSPQGKAVSCCGSKSMFLLMSFLAMLQVFLSVRHFANLLDKDIRRKDDIFLCIEIGQHVANGLLQCHYFYLLWSYQKPITKIIRKLKESTWASNLQHPLEIDDDPSVDCQVSAHNLLTEHDELEQICHKLNEILNLVLPYINVTSIITMSRLLQLCLRKSWIVAAFITFRLIQTWVIYIIGVRIANQAASFKLWFISKKTVSVLQINQKEYQSKLEQINMIPLGIGTDVFYTHVGFISSLFGVVLTYFFLATDAISDSR